MKLRKSDIAIVAVIALFGLYIYRGFSNGGDFTSLADLAIASVRGITNLIAPLMPDFSNMNW